MTDGPQTIEAVFLVNIVQDVTILRPLAIMAHRDFGFRVRFLVSDRFAARDTSGIWRRELDELAHSLEADRSVFATAFEALQMLNGHGLVFAGSESSVPGHATTHDVFRVTPSSYVRVTLQHGLECVGFRHNQAHTIAHGRSASFAADIVCVWFPVEHAISITPSQRTKLVVTGPTSVLQQYDQPLDTHADRPGLVCENLHSVRMTAMGDRKTDFIDVFREFCGVIDDAGVTGQIALRPHPGGQYFLRNKLGLPANATIENAPIYRLDLRAFAYGISAPSSVILDMVLAGIPTAVWYTEGMDVTNFTGLPLITTVADWVAFARAARENPAAFADGQATFLASHQLVIDRDAVWSAFGEIFDQARRNAPALISAQRSGGARIVLTPEIQQA